MKNLIFILFPVVCFSQTIKVESELYSAMSGIAVIDATEGTKLIGYVDNTDWWEHKINVATAGKYTINFRVAAVIAGASFKITNGTTTLLTQTVPATGDYQKFTTVSNTITLPAGSLTLRFTSTSAVYWNINWFELVPQITVPSTTITNAYTKAQTDSAINSKVSALVELIIKSGAKDTLILDKYYLILNKRQ